MFIPSVILVIFFVVLGGFLISYACVRRFNRLLILKLNDALHKKAEIGNFLTLFSQNLRTVEEIDNSMNMTARYVADLVESQSLCIFNLEGEFLKAVGISGAFPPLHKSPDYVLTKPRYILESLRREKIKVGEGIIGEVAKNKDSIFLEEAADDHRLADIDSVVPIYTLMAVPMVDQGKVIGVICAVNNRREDRPFSPEQFSRFKFIASQVVLAHNIVEVYSTLSEQQRINQELVFARELQAALLPKKFPEWDQFVVHSFARSAKEVSGDFYDFVEIDQDRLLIVVGDASGKGVPACMIMAMTRSFIRSNIQRFKSLKDMLKELNDNIFRDTDTERFITLACCLLNRKESTIEYARAGHTSMIMYVREHFRKIYPDGSALGLLPSDLADFDTFCFEFTPNMSLLMFTDGITEALSPDEKEYGEKRLAEAFWKSCLQDESPDTITENILKSVDEFTGPVTSQIDDQTIVIIRHL